MKVCITHRSPVIAQSLVVLLEKHQIDAKELRWKNLARLKRELIDISPQVLLVDPTIGSLNPGRLVEEMESVAEISISMMAVDGTAERLDEAVTAGASGFVSLDTSVDEFVGSVKLLAQGNVVATTPPETTLADIAVSEPASASQSQLSSRELQITQLVAQGLTNRQIAERCELTEGTVKAHLRNIFRKLNISNRAELASFAYVSGITTP